MRLDGNQRLGPKAPTGVNFVDLITNILGADLGEGAGKARVVRNERAIQI